MTVDAKNVSSNFSKKELEMLGDFVERAQQMTEEEIKKNLVKYSRTIVATGKDADADVELTKARQEVKALYDPYNAIIKECKLMNKYLISVMEDRGIAI